MVAADAVGILAGSFNRRNSLHKRSFEFVLGTNRQVALLGHMTLLISRSSILWSSASCFSRYSWHKRAPSLVGSDAYSSLRAKMTGTLTTNED